MIRPIFAAALATAVGLSTACAQSAGADYPRERDRLDALIETESYEAAFALVSDLNAAYPHDPGQWRRQGALAYELGDWDGAADAYIHAFEIGTRSQAYVARRIAEARVRAGDVESGLDWLERALDARLDNRFDLVELDAFAAVRDDPRFLRLAGVPVEPVDDRAARWRHDIDFLVEEAQRMHAGPERPAFSEAFVSGAERLKARVEELADTEILMELQRLVVLLSDGHSYAAPRPPHPRAIAPADIEMRTLPVSFRAFGEDVYVIDGVETGRDLIGGRVTAIGGVPASEFIGAMQPYVHHDNAETWKYLGVHFFMRGLALHQALGTADEGRVHIAARMPDGSEMEREVTAGDYDFPRKLRLMQMQRLGAMFLARADEMYWFLPLRPGEIYYAQINNFRNAEGEPLADFAARMGEAAIESGARALIVDFRLNNGGNNSLCRPLLRQLVRFETADPDNRIFVITRHETFSAAQNCANRIEALTDAEFVGERSSSSPNFTGEETNVVLPYSGLRVSISNRYWQDSDPLDARAWIPMDIPAELTFADYFDGRDPALEAIFARLETVE